MIPLLVRRGSSHGVATATTPGPIHGFFPTRALRQMNSLPRSLSAIKSPPSSPLFLPFHRPSSSSPPPPLPSAVGKMRMVDLGSHRGPLRIIDAPTDVDCSKDVGLRRTFRSLVECMVPCCGFQASHDSRESDAEWPLGSTVTGTFFGFRRGRVSFCLQEDGRSPPLFLLELSLPTAYLAREMQCGLLRIALESDKSSLRRPLVGAGAGSLFSVPVWSMYCNGRKMGFAVRRQMSERDASIFKLMQSVSVGAGVLPGESKAGEGDLMYLRASFERVIGSADSESFHLINPVGSSGQQLSIFLLRS